MATIYHTGLPCRAGGLRIHLHTQVSFAIILPAGGNELRLNTFGLWLPSPEGLLVGCSPSPTHPRGAPPSSPRQGSLLPAVPITGMSSASHLLTAFPIAPVHGSFGPSHSHLLGAVLCPEQYFFL